MKLQVNYSSLLKDIFSIIVSVFLFSSVYTLIVYKNFNFLERAINKSLTSPNKISSQKIKEITIDEALKIIQTQNPLLIDARNENDYLTLRIKDAINIPAKNFDNYLDFIFTIPKDTLIIIYCEGIHCNLSHQLAEKMLNFGFTNLKIMYEGIEGWQQRNLPVIKNEN